MDSGFRFQTGGAFWKTLLMQLWREQILHHPMSCMLMGVPRQCKMVGGEGLRFRVLQRALKLQAVSSRVRGE